MTIDLYQTPTSAPCRTVLMVAAALNIKLNAKPVDLMAGEHLKPEYLKINPQHTVPTLVDDGFVLSESRAIIRYLVNNYKEDSPLYPKEPKARALIDEKLDFDVGTLYARFAIWFYPQVFVGAPDNVELRKKVDDALAVLNSTLEGKKYTAGANMTLADYALTSTVSLIEISAITLAPYPNVIRWLELMKSTAPNYEETNEKGLKLVKEIIAERLPKSEL